MSSMTQLSGQIQRLTQSRAQTMLPDEQANLDAQIEDTRAMMRALAQEFNLPYGVTSSDPPPGSVRLRQ